MKTLQELYNEVLDSEELKKSFAEAIQNNSIEDFLKANGCEASKEELAELLKEQQAKVGEISDDELDSVAGGCNGNEAAISAMSAGLVCAALAIASTVTGSNKGDKGEILCDNVDW